MLGPNNGHRMSPLVITSLLLMASASAFPLTIHAADLSCPEAVYSECWAQGRNVDTTTCTCNPFSCLGVPESDCTEQGMRLDYSTCTCVGSPGDQGVCDVDPYSCGCPRSFDNWLCDPRFPGGSN